jgi:hypothetical protein
MELAELTFEEQVVLVALLELVISSDGRVSDEEHEHVKRIAGAIGGEAYRRAAAEVDRRFRNEEQLRMFVPTIARPAARETIFEAVLETALTEAIDPHESTLLGWLAEAWKLKVRPQGSGRAR